MKNIQIMDCTLRDGGYINEWMFGRENIRRIIQLLIKSEIDIIECGFLTNQKDASKDSSQFISMDEICAYLPSKRGKSMLVAMVNYGEFDPVMLTNRGTNTIDGIRVAFHKKDIEEALKICSIIKEKGYMLFMQPMVSLNYNDEEFLSLIHQANKIKPYAFYIVDSFGSMKREDLLHLLYLVDYNLDNSIKIGFHSHNNLQLSYSHAQMLVSHQTRKSLIIDSCVMGMGRGAGNLNTELFAEFLNQLTGTSYKIEPLLKIMDTVLNTIYQNRYWGYSLPHYLSAIHNCHPNYASYLDNKNTLTAEGINTIFSSMDLSMKSVYDKKYIEKLYLDYQKDKIADTQAREVLSWEFSGKDVLLLMPGRSLSEEEAKVKIAAEEPNTVVISVNFIPVNFRCDHVFISNARRWESVRSQNIKNLIITSNIRERNKKALIVNYEDLLNDIEPVRDNAGLLLIKLLISTGARSIRLAGMDGYSLHGNNNFIYPELEFTKTEAVMQAMNLGISAALREFSEEISISFLTLPKNIRT